MDMATDNKNKWGSWASGFGARLDHAERKSSVLSKRSGQFNLANQDSMYSGIDLFRFEPGQDPLSTNVNK